MKCKKSIAILCLSLLFLNIYAQEGNKEELLSDYEKQFNLLDSLLNVHLHFMDNCVDSQHELLNPPPVFNKI